MGLLDRLADMARRSSTAEKAKGDQPPPGWLRATAAATGLGSFDPAMWKNQAELYMRLSWAQQAISIVSRSIATTPFSVKQLVGEKEKAIVNHDFELLIARPNPLVSRSEFIEATASFRALTGNAYWWLNKPNEDAPPIEMWNIPSYAITPIPDERLYLRGYMYNPGDGQEIPMEPWEIVHFKSFNPLSTFVGLSPIEALATIAVGDMKMQDWNTRLFGENNARLPGILAFADPIADPEWEAIKEDIDESAKKRQIMRMRNVGKGGVQWMQAAMSQKDMEFLAGRKANMEEIFGIYAPGLASMLDVNATEANARTGRATFSDYCLWPLLVSIAEKITNDLLPLYGDNLRGEFEDIRYVDRAQQLEEVARYSETHTIDEVREKFYDDPGIGDERGKLLPVQIASAPVDAEGQPVSTFGGGFGEPGPEEPEDTEEPEEEVGDEDKIESEKKAWRNFAVRRLGKEARQFKCSHVPQDEQRRIRAALKSCKTEEDVDRAFLDADYQPLIESIEQAMGALIASE